MDNRGQVEKLDIGLQLPNRDLLLCEEVTEFLRISRQSVYRLRDEGQIEGVKVKGCLRFFRDSVLAYVERLKQKED